MTERLAELFKSKLAADAGAPLLELVQALEADNQSLEADNHSLKETTEKLGHQIAHLTRLLFGRRSEKLSKEELGQLVLALGGDEAQANAESPEVPHPVGASELDDSKSAPKAKKKRRHPGRTRLSEDLERIVVETTVPAEERSCSCCGQEMSTIGYQEHERVEYIPAQVVVNLERREKLGCRACRGDAMTAERVAPTPIVGRADVSILAHLLEAKCDDALPIHRQADQLARLGWKVPTNTLYGYWKHATALIEPLAHVMQSTILGGPIVAIDDTKLDFLDEQERSKRKRGHLWAFASPGGMIAYAFTKTWVAQEVSAWILAAPGFIQVDDYKGYSSMVLTPEGMSVPLVPEDRRLGCGMHIRRRFEKALKAGDKRAAKPMQLFASIYEIEREAKGLPPDERLKLRKKLSWPLLDQLDSWVAEQSRSLRPTELLSSACQYASHQAVFFRRCFSDGRFEIDNGDVERGMRKIAVGRRNWLFSGAAAGGPRIAAAYTLVGSCRRLGLPTREYLVDVMTKIDSGWPMRRIGELLPDAWARQRALLSDH